MKYLVFVSVVVFCIFLFVFVYEGDGGQVIYVFDYVLIGVMVDYCYK